jgi:hypothetical protein
MHRSMLAITVTFALGAGCAADPETEVPEDPAPEEEEPLAQGLTLFTQNAADGLTAMYAEGEEAVFLETAREVVAGEIGDDHYSFLADGTPVNISIRFSDIEGRALITAISGDLAPEAWNRGIPRFTAADRGRRPLLGMMIIRAARALAQAQVAAEMYPEVDRVVALAEHAPIEAEPHQEPERPAAMRTWEPEGWFYQDFKVKYKSITGGHHSATQWWNCEGGGVGCYDFHSTDNHGTTAAEMAAIRCQNVSPWKYQGYESYESASSCDGITIYHYCGWGGVPDHNCHDDTKVQLKRILCGTSPWQVCSGWGCDTKAPSYCGC